MKKLIIALLFFIAAGSYTAQAQIEIELKFHIKIGGGGTPPGAPVLVDTAKQKVAVARPHVAMHTPDKTKSAELARVAHTFSVTPKTALVPQQVLNFGNGANVYYGAVTINNVPTPKEDSTGHSYVPLPTKAIAVVAPVDTTIKKSVPQQATPAFQKFRKSKNYIEFEAMASEKYKNLDIPDKKFTEADFNTKTNSNWFGTKIRLFGRRCQPLEAMKEVELLDSCINVQGKDTILKTGYEYVLNMKKQWGVIRIQPLWDSKCKKTYWLTDFAPLQESASMVRNGQKLGILFPLKIKGKRSYVEQFKKTSSG